ncbi:MAG TPA: Shedu immune nuclease family protein [Pyrinomonadaceae bacterium]|nr:Shedu immune nuclease family protein [Pyrinomonadaceae bacterium]
MATKKKPTTKRAARRKPARNYVVVTNRTYGKALKGTRIYWEGRRPTSLGDDGRINLGKNILEILSAQFPKFRWIITKDVNSIKIERGIAKVRTSQQLLSRMNSEQIDRNRDIKNDIIRKFFAINFGEFFKEVATPVYVPGTLAKALHAEIIPRLSSQDKEALNKFLPDYVSSESLGTVNKLKATAQIETLKGLAADLEKEIPREHPESWWQSYVKGNILLMQQGYITAVEKLNLAIGDTKFPDFLLVTHDNYLDVLEIKKPNTPILKPDASRGNFYFDSELSKAIIQTENYIHNVSRHQDTVRSYLKDRHGIEIRAVRPRGIILAGDSRDFKLPKEQDDFRLLSQGIKNVTLVTYDEMLTRLQNYISVLEEFSKQ